MRNRAIRIALAIAGVAAFGSGAILMEGPAVAADTQPAAQSDPLQFARGAQAWANNCARCHNMRDPKELRDDQWRAVVSHMRVRGGLTGAEARDVLIFLQGSN